MVVAGPVPPPMGREKKRGGRGSGHTLIALVVGHRSDNRRNPLFATDTNAHTANKGDQSRRRDKLEGPIVPCEPLVPACALLRAIVGGPPARRPRDPPNDEEERTRMKPTRGSSSRREQTRAKGGQTFTCVPCLRLAVPQRVVVASIARGLGAGMERSTPHQQRLRSPIDFSQSQSPSTLPPHRLQARGGLNSKKPRRTSDAGTAPPPPAPPIDRAPPPPSASTITITGGSSSTRRR